MRCRKRKSKEIGVDISSAISDENGLPRVYRRYGQALVLSITLVPEKVYTAAITPVSYTHLDVYKRQVENPEIPRQKDAGILRCCIPVYPCRLRGFSLRWGHTGGREV